MTARAVLLALVAALLLGGCYRSRDEVIQKESIGYIRFTGQVGGAVASVSRDGQPILSDELLAPPDAKEAPNRSYTVRPGMYLVQVARGGEVVVRREIYVSDGMTREVRVP